MMFREVAHVRPIVTMVLSGGSASEFNPLHNDLLLDTKPNIVEFRLSRDAGVTLVRPDGYIAYSAQRRDLIPTLTSVHSLLERQTD
jgi:hypothetical protein